jgi:hypothetical protein
MPPRAECMSASQINKALDRLDKQSSKVTDEFIDAGRGRERPSEIRQMTDPLARRYMAVADAQHELRAEIARRYGPGAPSRLPRGFGPIRKCP